MAQPRYENQSAERCFAILECVGAAENPVPLAEVTRTTGLNRATTYRLLAVLTRLEPDEVRQLFAQHQPYVHTAKTISSIDGLIRELGRIRKQGYATDEGEMIPDLDCVAAPIMNSIGRAARLTATANEISEYIIERGATLDAD